MGLNSIVGALLEGCRYHSDRENGWFLSIPLWWCDQYGRPPLQSQHLPLTSSNNWIPNWLYFVATHISRFSRGPSFILDVMDSTSGWQRSHSGVGNCVLYTRGQMRLFLFSNSWIVSLQVSYRYITVNSYRLCVLKRPLSSPEHRWDDNAKRNLKGRWGSVVWTHRVLEYGGSRFIRNVGKLLLTTYREYGGTCSLRSICIFLRDYTASRTFPPSR